jgi:hypothetical protein
LLVLFGDEARRPVPEENEVENASMRTVRRDRRMTTTIVNIAMEGFIAQNPKEG